MVIDEKELIWLPSIVLMYVTAELLACCCFEFENELAVFYYHYKAHLNCQDYMQIYLYNPFHPNVLVHTQG